MKTIIATTDYSSDAYYAVHYAARLAAAFDAQLLLFNAFQLSVHATHALVSPATVDQLLENNKIRLAGLGRDLSNTYHIEVQCMSYMSEVEEALEKLLAQYDADLVVMGMQNKLAENRILGNTTTSVIKKANYPVLVVPFGAEFKGIEKILFTRDEKALHEEDKNMQLLKGMAHILKAEIEVFHVEKMPVKRSDQRRKEVQEDSLEQVLKDTHHSYKMANGDNIVERIVEEMKAYQPDLLVMIPHQGNFIDDLLKRSITRKMVMETQIPLLALPELNVQVATQKSPA